MKAMAGKQVLAKKMVSGFSIYSFAGGGAAGV